MAEISHHGECQDSNPITCTESKLLLGIPNYSSSDQPPIANNSINEQSTVNHHGDDVGGDHGNDVPIVMGAGHPDDTSSSSSSSDEEEGEEEGEGSSESSEEEELTEEVQLKNAGVDIDLHGLGTPSEGGVAPLHLLSEFVSCCVRDEYGAALILCKKVLEFEPDNQTAKDFLPMLQERLKLDDELSTESSSDDEISSGSAEEVVEGNHTTTAHSHHC